MPKKLSGNCSGNLCLIPLAIPLTEVNQISGQPIWTLIILLEYPRLFLNYSTHIQQSQVIY